MTPPTVNVLLSSFPGLSLPSTLSFSLPSTSSIKDLTERVTAYLPTTVPFQSLSLSTTDNKQILPSSEGLVSSLVTSNDGNRYTINDLLPLRLTIPLRGGKGGFGSQLRAAGGRMSSKRKRNQGENDASSRNLDGRRIRTVNEAKALAEYLAVKPEMDKRQKDERRRRWLAVVEAAETRQEELKNGGGKKRIDGQWMEDREEMGEKAREAVFEAMKDDTWTDNLRDAPAAVGGSSTSASDEGSSSRDSSSGSDEENEDDSDEVEQGPVPSEAPRAPVAPKKFVGFDDDDEFMSDSDDEVSDQEESKGKGKGKAKA